MGFSSQEYWSSLPFPPTEDLPNPGIEPASPAAPALQADSLPLRYSKGLARWLSGKESACNAGAVGDAGSIPGSERSPGEGNGNPVHYFLPEKSRGHRSLAGYSPKGHKELDLTEQLSTYNAS